MKDIFTLNFTKSTSGELIRAQRTGFGLTLKDLCEATGVLPSYLSAIETGRSPIGPELAYILAAALGLSAKMILMPRGYESPFKNRISTVEKKMKIILSRKESSQNQRWKKLVANSLK
jgi:transcriptional regulator with XRE-family HTH domain